MVERPSPNEIPDAPGAYLFRDDHGAVVYVGKAKSLRKRVTSYFVGDHEMRTRAMLEGAGSVEWISTANEVEAIMLEYTLIHQHAPRFNIRLRDDKSYPFLVLTDTDEWPRAAVVRGRHRKGNRYFGPYAHAYAIRQTLDLVLRTFPVRTCSDTKFRRHEARGRPCLLFDIERCSGPCVGAVDRADYDGYVEGLARFLDGDSDDMVATLQTEMQEASEALEFERAARVRDRIAAVERALATQEVVSSNREDFDLFAVAEDDLEAALVVLTVRHGRVVGRRASIVDKVEDLSTADLIGRMIEDAYGDGQPPKQVLVAELPDDPNIWEAWLAHRRGNGVSLRVPRRGAKRRLMETARRNAEEEFQRHRLKRASDHNARAAALRNLQERLDLPEPPLRIEAYDISTIQGTDTVGSMVVMEDGLPKRRDYRRFKVRSVSGQDDFAAMEEVLTRRLTAHLAERRQPAEERGSFAYPPSLLLVDGGAGQLGRAVSVLATLGLDIPVVGLAKRLEEVYVPGRPEPLRIPRGEPALHLLQQIRDEAHRFAVGYHRTLRSRRMVGSVLDDVPGIGPERRKALMRRFGSIKRMREATVDELASVVPARVATDLHALLVGDQPSRPRGDA
ncbi:MAG TPA: excinuclease ABC subunit UvrC [Acidimicrobiia bacterium]|nr:excinuclease ABC subunit UvrC [Acidimicrobiia bacterium]